jgi:hypothetical protein
VSIEVRKLEVQELVLVLPLLLACGKTFDLSWCWRRICNLCNEICCGCFGYSVDENAEERDAQEDVEANTKSKEKPLSVVEPVLFLLFGELDSREVRLKLVLQ